MPSYEIICIKKAGGLLPNNQKITHIGYIDDVRYVIPIEQAILMLENKICDFYVSDIVTKKKINVIVVITSYLSRSQYLRTVADGIETDNLEQLPECN